MEMQAVSVLTSTLLATTTQKTTSSDEVDDAGSTLKGRSGSDAIREIQELIANKMVPTTEHRNHHQSEQNNINDIVNQLAATDLQKTKNHIQQLHQQQNQQHQYQQHDEQIDEDYKSESSRHTEESLDDNQPQSLPANHSTKGQYDYDISGQQFEGDGQDNNLISSEANCKSNGSLSSASNSPAGNTSLNNLNGSLNGTLATPYATAQNKKRISSSRTPTRKAKRIKFYRNGDRFYPGITIPVSNERYRSFGSLFEDLTRLLEDNVKIPGAVRTIYSMDGKKICSLDELEDGQSYVCSCNNESFKKIEYNTSSQPLANLTLSNKTSRLTKTCRPSSPLKNGANIHKIENLNNSPLDLSERDSVVHPRIVTLIRNGTKPRKIMRLLLNKRNSPSYDHVLTAITQVVKLDTGYVRKVFTLSGNPVLQLGDFFKNEDVFFAYGTERVNNPDDFKLEADENRALQAIRKNLRTPGVTCSGPKPKMPIKSKKVYDKNKLTDMSGDAPSTNNELNDIVIPSILREQFSFGEMIGDGNFAVVVKIQERLTGQRYALKVIDKSKCKGKEYYIDAEIRVMKKLNHPNIISLIKEVNHDENMYLILEYVSGGDLFDAITRVTRFSEDQSRVMIRHLASAMAYLHSLGIVHRDIKPENLLVELDDKGNVIDLKLADFGLACEVTGPLYAVCGTPTYVAPEILMETGYGVKIDVWAAGIILYILLCGFPPFVSPDNQQEPLFDAIISGVYEFPEPYWTDIGDGVRDLINNMLQSEPDVRFSSEDVLDHFWTLNEVEEYPTNY